MRHCRTHAFPTAAIFLAAMLCSSALFHPIAWGKESGKYLIELGWDCPTPAFIHKYISDMQRRPFDGVVFKLQGKARRLTDSDASLPALHTTEGPVDLQGGSRVFLPVTYDEADFQREYDLLSEIAWGRMQHNFVLMYSASDQDWFNDAHWHAIENNARLIARAARAGNCKGLVFDPEPYGPSPWNYEETVKRRQASFVEYESVVRKRGAQFIRAIESELQDFTFLSLFLLTALRDLSSPMDDARRAENLEDDRYGLLPAFFQGMLEAAGPDVCFVDGNEDAYYYKRREAYFESYHFVREGARRLVDAALREPYARQVRMGQSVYLDEYLGTRPGGVRSHATHMLPDERLDWAEHNAFWALYTSDCYVWCYNERIVWWNFEGISDEELTEMGMAWPAERTIPPGCEQALRRAKRMCLEGHFPRVDLEPAMTRAESIRGLY